MITPNADRAVVDIRKLRDYCLDPEHDEGKHKARLFKDAKLGRRDGYGQRYVVDFVLEWRGKRAMVRSAWIIEHNADTPKLTSCYPL